LIAAKAKEVSMLGKILGAIAGKRAAKHTNKVGGMSGAVLGGSPVRSSGGRASLA
jgi:hypothetical protein